MRFYLIIALMGIILWGSYDYQACRGSFADFRRAQLDPPIRPANLNSRQRELERQRFADLEARWPRLFADAS